MAQRNILLGVTGGIAAFKAAELVRLLGQRIPGCSVRVVMTAGAQQFVAPLTFQALTGNPVHTELLDPAAEQGMGHIELARWADLVLVAPATANALAKLSAGMADDLLTTVALARRCPLAVAPAMNAAMWANVATAENVATLRRRGVHVWGPAAGVQACGDVGEGRLEEPEALCRRCEDLFAPAPKSLAGRRVVLTAGPTCEALDPVRYITNHSSGKMGFAVAAAARDAGAEVVVISGKTTAAPPAGVDVRWVRSTVEMRDAAVAAVTEARVDVFVAAAAVCDFRPAVQADQKLKKTDDSDTMTLTLVKNPDIVATIAGMQAPERPRVVVGFAAETQDVLGYARGKLERKNLDAIVANDVSCPGTGFNSDDNEATLLWRGGDLHFETQPKATLAAGIVGKVSALFFSEQ